MNKRVCSGHWPRLVATSVSAVAVMQGAVGSDVKVFINVGESRVGCPVAGSMTFRGFASGKFGSFFHAGLAGARTVTAMHDIVVSLLTCGSDSAVFRVAGFRSN